MAPMKTSTIIRSSLLALGVTGAAYALGGCVVAARPGVYGTYGYTTYAQPNTVYYQGGNYGGTYYRPGYYYRNAPFFQGYSGAVVAQPVYAQPTYVRPAYAQPAYGASVNVAVPGVSGAVRVGP